MDPLVRGRATQYPPANKVVTKEVNKAVFDLTKTGHLWSEWGWSHNIRTKLIPLRDLLKLEKKLNIVREL